VRQVDLEQDGEMEIVLTNWNQSVVVLAGDGTVVLRVHFSGQGVRGSIRSAQPVQTEAGLSWLVVFHWYGVDDEPETASCGLIEVVVGLTTYRREQHGEHEYALVDRDAHLVLLDLSGRRLVQRDIGAGLENVSITQPRDGSLPRIICIQRDAARTFELRP
jgi:hypothetical protein